MRLNLLNLLFPPQCLVCNALVPTDGTLCNSCWQQIRFISVPQCACCGLPFDFPMESDALCAECIRERPPYSRARAVFAYDDASRALVLKLKYSDQTQLAKIYAPWLAKAGQELLSTADIIIPVPLHYWRFVSRRYNQSALLARALSRHTGITLQPNALKRIRYTPPQTGLTRKERSDNVKGAFRVPAKYQQMIKDKRIVLIDDVLTTAATAQHCAKALLKAGAANVDVLTLARSVR